MKRFRETHSTDELAALALSDEKVARGFSQRLRAIREDVAAKAAASRRDEVEADLAASARHLAALDFLRQVEAVISPRLADLATVADGFVLSRRFFDGRYRLALRHEGAGENEDEGTGYSRLAFLLAPHANDGRFEVECRKTVHAEDRDGERREVSLDAGGLASLAEFVEAQVVAFAEGFFSATTSRRAG